MGHHYSIGHRRIASLGGENKQIDLLAAWLHLSSLLVGYVAGPGSSPGSSITRVMKAVGGSTYSTSLTDDQSARAGLCNAKAS